MATNTTRTDMRVADCPACHAEIVARATVEMKLGPVMPNADSEAIVNVTGKVTGLRIEHDCTPKATR